MVDDPKGLDMLAKAQDAQLDYEFFLILSNALEQEAAAGDEESAQKLRTLREKLMPLTSWGKRAAKQEAAVASLEGVKSPDELLAKVIEADLEVVEAMAIAARPLMDYGFFEKLTERIDAGKGPEKDRLVKLRDRLLTITQQVDEAARASFQEASELLGELMNSPDPRAAVRQRAEEIDNVFMSVLSLNLQEAERRGAKEAQQRLQAIWREILSVVEEEMPPEIRLINELLRAQYPDATRALLKQRQGEVTSELLSLMDRLAEDLVERNDPDAAKRLRDIKAQAMLLV
jgi:hypothetical protein